MASKSYWTGVVCDTDRAKKNIKVWFEPLCEGMTPYKAEILCDIATDREKKLRAFMTGSDDRTRYRFERTQTRDGFKISKKRLVP